MTFKGSCHCGGIAFEAEGELKGVMQCNCSICERKGSLLWFIPSVYNRPIRQHGIADGSR